MNRRPGRKRELVIVGNGMASFELCRRLVEQDSDDLQITVIGEESRPAYDRVRLTAGFSSGDVDSLLFQPRQWYSDHGIRLKLDARVTWIDRSRQTVSGTGSLIARYDQLVLATGSRVFVPPIEGTNLRYVYVYRTVDDILQIKQDVQHASRAIVLGGGLLGLEAAKALVDEGLQTHVVEAAPRLMPRQLDAESGALLRSYVEAAGVNVLTATRVTAIARSKSRTSRLSVEFENADVMDTDLVVIAAGVRPRDELANSVGLKVHPRGGVQINQRCETSDHKIFAIGECAEHDGVVYGLVGPCYQMAATVASQLCGGNLQFHGSDESTTLKLMGVDVSTLGQSLDRASGGTILAFQSNGVCRKLIVEEGVLTGAMGVGPWSTIGQFRDAIQSGRQLSRWELELFQQTGNLRTADEELSAAREADTATICHCVGVTKGTIVAAVQSGCSSLKSITDSTRAGSVCGSCHAAIAELCGQPEGVQRPAGSRLLIGVSAAAAIFALLILATPSLAGSNSVQGVWSVIDTVWRSSIWRQITGFTLIGVVAVSMAISLRKRIPAIQWGGFHYWRLFHATFAATALLGFAFHTGLRFGSNLNFALSSIFLLTSVCGAVAGFVTAYEPELKGNLALLARRWRPRLLWIHILLTWPLPVMLIFHVVAAYCF